MLPFRPFAVDTGELCVICMCKNPTPAMICGCDHKFCYVCIYSWSKKWTNCPVCRKYFNIIVYQTDSEGFRMTRVPTRLPETHSELIRHYSRGWVMLKDLSEQERRHLDDVPFMTFLRKALVDGTYHADFCQSLEERLTPTSQVDYFNPFYNVDPSTRLSPGIVLTALTERKSVYLADLWVHPWSFMVQPDGQLQSTLIYVHLNRGSFERITPFLYREILCCWEDLCTFDRAMIFDVIMSFVKTYDLFEDHVVNHMNTLCCPSPLHFLHELSVFILSGLSVEDYDAATVFSASHAGPPPPIQPPDTLAPDTLPPESIPHEQCSPIPAATNHHHLATDPSHHDALDDDVMCLGVFDSTGNRLDQEGGLPEDYDAESELVDVVTV